MKKFLILFLFFSKYIVAQTTTENYVKSTIYREKTTSSIISPTINQAFQNIDYLDGFGRVVQKIKSKQSGNGKNVVVPFEYDALGRQVKKYMPYVAQATGLNYVPTALNDVLNFPSYLNQNPYDHFVFDAAINNRILKRGAPGLSWAINPSGADQTEKKNIIRMGEVKLRYTMPFRPG